MNTAVKRLCMYKMARWRAFRLSNSINVVTVKSLKADVSSVRAIDEGLTLEMSAFD